MYNPLTLSLYQGKWKIGVLLLFKSKLLFDDESYKTLWESEDSCGMVLVSPSAS